MDVVRSANLAVRFLLELCALAAHLALEVLVFAAATVALVAAGRPALAGALAIAFVVNRTLLAVWGQ